MRFILTLFKKILSALGNIYTKEEVDTVLEPKLEVDELEEAVLGETGAMYEAYDGHVDSADEWNARSKALANIAKWRTYASAMQSMVDAEMATMIAEEFEKAAQKYLENPEATEEWRVAKEADETYISTSPYSESPPDRPVIDFNVIGVYGYYLNKDEYHGIFHKDTNVPVFLPRLESAYRVFMYTSFSSVICLPNLITSQQLFQGGYAEPVAFTPNVDIASYMFRHLGYFNRKVKLNFATVVNSLCESDRSFNSEVFLPLATDCAAMLSGAVAFNQPLSLPSATICNNLLQNCSYFNQPLSIPNATKCRYMLQGATSFNQPLDLKFANDCTYMLNKASKFNQPLSLPSATDCSYMLQEATSFNSELSLPEVKSCSHMLQDATAYNQPLSLPKAEDCTSLLQGSSSFDQAVDIPMASKCDYMLYSARKFNQPISLIRAWSVTSMLEYATSFNQPIDFKNVKVASRLLYGASSFNSTINLPIATSVFGMLYGCSSFNQPLDLPKATDCASLLYRATSFNHPLNLPECTHAYYLLNTASSFNNPVYLPKVRNAAGAFTNTKMSAENIAITFRSFPVFSAEGSSSAKGTVTILYTPGSAHTDTTESFTVTDDDGTEYTMDNCPVFTNDDENQTLRKEFVLITVKKGWTVEL